MWSSPLTFTSQFGNNAEHGIISWVVFVPNEKKLIGQIGMQLEGGHQAITDRETNRWVASQTQFVIELLAAAKGKDNL